MSALRIQAPHQIHFIGGVPQVVILIDSEGVRRRALAGQLKLLESFGLGVKPRNLAAHIFGKPNHAIGINLDAPRPGMRSGRGPFRHFARFRIDLPDLSLIVKLSEPGIAVLIDFHTVG